MKKLIALTFAACIAISGYSQIKKPAKWGEPVLSKKSPAVGETIEITFNATIDAGWYLYSSDFDPDLGPIVTTFDYEGSSGVDIIGDIQPINPKKAYDDLWGGDYTYFEPTGQFKQKVKITEANPTVQVRVDYQTCQHEGSCISDKKKFTIEIKTSAKSSESASSENKTSDSKTTTENKTSAQNTNEPKTTPKEETNKNESANTEVKVEGMQFTVDTSAASSVEMPMETESYVKGADKIATSTGDFGRGKDGKEYVLVNNQWYRVPDENSPKFYRKYLMLGGKHIE